MKPGFRQMQISNKPVSHCCLEICEDSTAPKLSILSESILLCQSRLMLKQTEQCWIGPRCLQLSGNQSIKSFLVTLWSLHIQMGHDTLIHIYNLLNSEKWTSTACKRLAYKNYCLWNAVKCVFACCSAVLVMHSGILCHFCSASFCRIPRGVILNTRHFIPRHLLFVSGCFILTNRIGENTDR